MSKIVLIKDSEELKKEIRTVMVPDYQSQIDSIEELKQVTAKSVSETQKVVDLLGNSIIEQVSIYLLELLKPIIKYFKQINADIRWDMKWKDGNWVLEPRQEYGEKIYSKMQLRYSGRDKYIAIVFDTDKYEIIGKEEIDTEVIKSLAEQWPDFKRYTKQCIDTTIYKLKSDEEYYINHNQKTIDVFQNFKL